MAADENFSNLGIINTRRGRSIRVFSEHCTSLQLAIFNCHTKEIQKTVSLEKISPTLWEAFCEELLPGCHYGLYANGPQEPPHSFNPEKLLLDPFGKSVTYLGDQWVNVIPDEHFEWEDDLFPHILPHHERKNMVIYEAHVRSLTQLNPDIPEEIRGSYAAIAHPATLDMLCDLGIQAIELLPIQAFTSEQWLQKNGRTNHWGYNTLSYFAPHPSYASAAAQRQGPQAIIHEVKTMIQALHKAGLEVILDVVYNHTAEEGTGGPVLSFRGLDNANYYRQSNEGVYYDYTGCGNTLNFSHPAVVAFTQASLRYWVQHFHIDGFRFDLAVSLGRGDNECFDPYHPFFKTINTDPLLRNKIMIAEPWDLGPDGWRTGQFREPFYEWNDTYRDTIRDFWLTDHNRILHDETPNVSITRFANATSGSLDQFSAEHIPTRSVNFITAHDGFTLADLCAYNTKHNEANGEDNRDGTTNNRSYNHGYEGETTQSDINNARYKTMRNMFATQLFSTGIIMFPSGDEHAKTKYGNNNTYAQDNEISWLKWQHTQEETAFFDTVKTLIQLRKKHPQLRFRHNTPYLPSGKLPTHLADWYNQYGYTLTAEEWNDPRKRTFFHLTPSISHHPGKSRFLFLVHSSPFATDVFFPITSFSTSYRLLWSSLAEEEENTIFLPEQRRTLSSSVFEIYRLSPLTQ